MASGGGISVHGVDVARGRPAAGMRVEIFILEPARRVVAEGRLGPNGALDHPITRGAAAGTYEVIFHAGEFFAGAGVSDGAGFLDLVPFRFTIADATQHYHLPLKITPWGFSLFRGS